MLTRRSFIGALALSAAVLAGCSSGGTENLPDGATLLKESAAAARNITSSHFTLDVNGQIEGISVETAEGDLTREGGPGGGAKGTIKLTIGGQLIEGEFVLVNDQLYLKGPTGAFSQYPSSLTDDYYDPSAILDPERGFARVMENITEPKTEALEEINGVSAYKITGRATRDVVADLVPGVRTDVGVTVWVREEGDHQPIRVLVTFPEKDGETPTVDVTLSDVNKPVTVTPPA